MAWTTPKTWTASSGITAAEFNTHIRDNLNWLKGAFTQLNVTSDSAKAKITPALVGARVHKTSNTTLTTSVQTTLTFDSEIFDSDAFHDTVTNTSRLTIPASMGGYYLCGGAAFFASNATGRRVLWIYVNGGLTNYLVGNETSSTSAGGNYVDVVTLATFAAADYIELVAFQSSGGNLDITAVSGSGPAFWIHRMSST